VERRFAILSLEALMDKPARTRVEWTEIANAVVIALAGLLISYATYQAALWGGEEELAFTSANVKHTESVQQAMLAAAREAMGVQIFVHWFDAAGRHETDLANKYAARFPPALRPAFDAWIALRPFENPGAPPSPFSMPQYRIPEMTQAGALQQQADAAFRRGQKAKHVADTYGQAATILSTALFFAGIGQVFKADRVRLALLVLAGFGCALGITRLLTLPMISLLSNPS
jgi:hypothetical protein